jgi:hypothetical protein
MPDKDDGSPPVNDAGEPAVSGLAEQTSITDDASTPAPRKVRRSKRSQPRRKVARVPEDPGEELERRVARLEFADGALSRVRVPVRALRGSPGRDVVTDIDVLSLDVDLRLRLTRSAAECKSEVGEAGELDRLLWLAGLRELLDVPRGLLVRTTITRRGAALAAKLGLDLMDETTLAEREAANAWLPERFAHIGGVECAAAEKRADTQIKGVGAIAPGLVAFLRHGALLSTPFEVLGGIAALGEAVRNASVLPGTAGLILAGHGLVALLTSSVQDASRLGTVSDEVLKNQLALSLTTGQPDDTYILDVLGRADDFVRAEFDRLHEQYVEAGSKRLNIEPESLRALVGEEPPWLDRYVDFVHRLRGAPAVARDLLQTAELSVFEGAVGGKAISADAFAQLFTREHRSLLFAAVRMLEDIAGKLVVEPLGALRDLDWERTPPLVPDRRQSPTEQKNSAELATETSRSPSR